MNTSPHSPPAAAGANTTTPVDVDADLRAATPATVGADQTTAKADAGATNSPASTKRNTAHGKKPARPLDPDPELTPEEINLVTAPGWIVHLANSLRPQAEEIIYMRGAARVITACHDQDLDPGLWLLVRLPNKQDEPMDGQMAA